MSALNNSTNTRVERNHGMLTRRITTSYARNAVFNTAELLESILSELPLENIIAVRLVNKHWNAIIVTSPRIRRKLFLAPEPKYETWACDRKYQTIHKWRPDVVEHFGREWARRQYPITPATLNPLLFTREPEAERGTLMKRSEICESLRLLAKPDLANTTSIYRNMFVCMPPMTKAEFCFYYHVGERVSRRRKRCVTHFIRLRVENRQGVRFRDILETFLLHTGNGTRGLLRDHYSISKVASRLWMLGAVYGTEEEVELVEQALKKG